MKKIFSILSIPLIVLALVSLSSLKAQMIYAQDCGGPIPPAPTKVWATSGPGSGEVTLYWDTAPYADRYGVVYGTQTNKYVYGSLNIGGEKARSYTVKYLKPGSKYFFRMVAGHGCSTSPFSSEVSAFASGAGEFVSELPAPTQVSVGGPTVANVQPVTYTTTSGPVGKLNLRAMSGPMVGEVTLSWVNVDSADNYHLVYGTEHGKYQYGALNIGKLTSFTVRKLAAGKTYYFAIVPVIGGRALYTSDEVRVPAKTEIVEVQTNEVIPSQTQSVIPPVRPPTVEQPVQQQTLPPVVYSTPTPVQQVKGVMDESQPPVVPVDLDESQPPVVQ